ncbi:plasmid replication initiator RepA [Rhodobacteraceae bacterium 2CG4]|uniref:Plasmid replication initiator RepA n=1 Tax=Halovulum marinum TaxID=2662447 RepID=A0A6L5Z6H3_9RHOB|nr:replication initiator protein A [Halovulum marinum]MSU91700.1 plasmid replication initiator RepA [Halovulum marinum]
MAPALLPDRHPTGDFFVCDVLDAIPKDDLASMEHPVFSLSTRPDRRVLSYAHAGASIEITPSVKGLATIHDKDVLIYCVSQLMAAINAERPVSRRLVLTARDLLVATNRETSGDGYRRLREALERLSGTRIVTTIATGGLETTRGFGLIDSWEIVRRTRAGRMVSAEVVLSEWLYRAVLAKSVLTLSRDYFRLRKPLERRVYEIARKHCGRQREWTIGLATLLTKSGSTSPLRVFRKMIRDIAAADLLPDYTLSVEPGDLVRVCARARMTAAGAGAAGAGAAELPPLGAQAHERARAAAPGFDVYALEADWRAWWAASGRPRLHAPDAAFVAFCRTRAGRQ